MPPSPLLARALLARAAITWALARLFASAALALASTDPLRLAPLQATFIVAASVTLGLVDIRRRHERALLENLSLTRMQLLVIFAAPAVLGELAIRIAAH